MTDYTPATFRIDNAILADLKATAEREMRTQTAIVERALRAYIANSEAEARVEALNDPQVQAQLVAQRKAERATAA